MIEKEYGTGCIASQEIEDQAKRHLDCDASKTCDSSYYVGGFHGLDLIAWAMETNRAVYMIQMDCKVEVNEPFKAPYAIELKDASPSEEVTVMVYTGNHFNRDFVVQNRNNQKTTYCAKVGLEDPEQTGQITAKTWNAPMEQLTRTKVEQFQKADDAGKIQILENIDTGVSYDCTIKITEWNGRFEATVVRLTPV